jgi:uncharacterized protein (TIGR04222 family)
MDLMDLRGPDFLKVYAGLFVAAVVIGWVLRRWARGPAGPVPRDAADLDPLEVAYLAGGPRLAINTALASLYHAQSLRVTAGTRSLKAVRPPPDDVTRFEQGIYHYISTAPSRSVREVHKNFPVEIPARRPAAMGLVLSAGQRASLAVMSIMPLLVLSLLGATKVAVGLSRGRPVAFLILALAATAMAVVLFLANAPRRTPAGDRVLRALRSENAGLQSTAGSRALALSPMELALAVGLFGPAVLAGAGDMEDLRRAMQPANTSGGSSCGSGCGSACGSGGGGGSSCGGGGGCGGGGCGGCGGGCS